MKEKINKFLYIALGIFFIVIAIVLEVYWLIFMGLCMIVLGVSGGNAFTKKFEHGILREGVSFKRKK